MAPKTKRNKNKDNNRRAKKKVSILSQEKIDYVDWKDVNLLRRFISERAKVRARRVTGNNAQQQAKVAMAIKNAREMALIPYANRVTQQRNKRDGGGGDRGARAEGPPPRPTAPPPTRGADEADGEAADAEAPGVAEPAAAAPSTEAGEP